jgi:hypothetical protein
VRPKKSEAQESQHNENECRNPTCQPHPMSHATAPAAMVNGRLEENEPSRYFLATARA